LPVPYDTQTAQEPGSLYRRHACSDELAFHLSPSFSSRYRLRNWQGDFLSLSLLRNNNMVIHLQSFTSNQGCQFGFFEAKFVIEAKAFLRQENAQWNLNFFGHLDFLWRFGRFKDDFGRFLSTGRFLDTVSGHRMINFHWKLCTRIYNFFVLLFHAHKFAVSGFSSAKPKVSRSSLMEWALFFLCSLYCLSKAHLGVLKVSLCIHCVFGFLWVDLDFFIWLPGNPASNNGWRCFAACECWTQTFWQVMQRDTDYW